MKMRWQERKKRSKDNKKGSSIIMLGIIFVAFTLCITAGIGVARMLAVKSECEVFGRAWTKAILSEYDNHLFEDYGIMAYFGNESEVQKKIDLYLDYSTTDKMGALIKGSSSELYGYELGEPKNFKKGLKSALLPSVAEGIINGGNRQERKKIEDETSDNRKINDSVVLSTLPSGGINNTVDVTGFIEKAKTGISSENIYDSMTGYSAEIAFIKQYLGNKVTMADSKPSFFQNEMEYVLSGKTDDDANFRSCKRKLLLIRNALNLAAIYKDPQKVKMIVSIAEIITPGPGGIITQAIIAEIWALCEAEADIDALLNNERVPLIKTGDNWKTDLGSILNNDKLRKKLDDESKKLLDEKEEEINTIDGINNKRELLSEGLLYDDYLLLMIMTLNDNVRLLRIMDIVQINMKYRYYRDFNMMEYFVGVRFSIEANGRSYNFEDHYK